MTHQIPCEIYTISDNERQQIIINLMSLNVSIQNVKVIISTESNLY